MPDPREPAIKVEVIPRRVDPKVVDQLQTDVVDLKKKDKDKDKKIKDLELENANLVTRIEALEGIVVP